MKLLQTHIHFPDNVLQNIQAEWNPDIQTDHNPIWMEISVKLTGSQQT